MSEAYSPIKSEDTIPFIGKECVCANSEEGLGRFMMLATFIGVDRDSEYPYVCKVQYNKTIQSFKWIAMYP